MKMKSLNSFHFGVLIASLLIARPLAATPVVQFEPDDLSRNVMVRPPDERGSNAAIWHFSENDPLLDSRGEGEGRLVFGGVRSSWDGPDSDHVPSIAFFVASEGRGAFRIQVNPTDNTTAEATGVLLWKKANFLHGANTSNVQVSLKNGGLFSTTITNLAAHKASVRFVILSNGQLYASDDSASSNGDFSIEATRTLWRPMDRENYSLGQPTSPALNDIEGVGIFFNLERQGQHHQMQVRFESFRVDAETSH